jgi:hypothetical protein
MLLEWAYIANSSCHFGSYDSIWTGPYIKNGHMTVYGPVHILSYDPKWHELFAILYFLSKIMQVPGRSIYENSDRLR